MEGEVLDRASYVFGGRLVAKTDDFSVFESASGKILKLTGISRDVCERSLGTDITLREALEEADLEEKLTEQLQDHLVKMRMFHEGGMKGFFKKYFRFRLDLPLIPIQVVSLLCTGVQRSWNVLMPVSFVALLAGFAFLVALGGIPYGWPSGFSYKMFISAVLLNTFIHEMGHAYALFHCGQKPGVIGLRIMGPFIAAYTDVNGAWALDPKERALVSISGLSVQFVATIILTVALILGVNYQTGAVFFWATILTMIYMALPMRENDGDWFLKDMIEHTKEPKRKFHLYLIRKIFAIIGLVFFLTLIFRAWSGSYRMFMASDRSLDWSIWPHILRFAFLSLGTYSMINLALKEYHDIGGRLKGWWQKRSQSTQKPQMAKAA